MNELKANSKFIISVVIGVIFAFVNSALAIFYFITLALIYLFSGNTLNVVLLLYLVLFFSDSRSELFSFAESAKTVIILTVPIILFRIKRVSSIQPALYPFIIFSFFCFLNSNHMMVSFQKTLSYTIIAIGTPYLLLHFLESKRIDFLRIVILMAGLLLAIGLVLFFVNPDFVHLIGRYRGLLGNPNGLGIFLVVMFLFYEVILEKFPGIFTKREKWFLMTLFASSLLLCQSRSALGVFILFFVLKRIFQIAQVFGIASTVLILVFLNYITVDAVSIIMNLGLEEYFRIDTIKEGSGRLVAWEFAWENIQDTFFIGKGFAHNEFLYTKYYFYLSHLGHQGNVHNSFLTLWLDLGLIGLLLFLIPIISLFFKASQYSKKALPILFCFLFSANFESWLAASLNPFTIIFYMTLTLLLYQPEEELLGEGESS